MGESIMMEDTELLELCGALNAWHTNATNQLRLITENRDSDMEIDGNLIEAGSEFARGMRFGILLSMQLLGKLPIKLNYNTSKING
jgi:hypothetical protein